MHDNRIGNLLGALALTVGDLILADVTRAAGTSASGAAAMAVLSTAPGLSVTELGRRVGLSQPAAARMLDSLEDRGLVERRGTGGRPVAVHLTAEGTAAAGRVLGSRMERLTTLAEALDEDERRALDALLSKLLTTAYAQASAAASPQRSFASSRAQAVITAARLCRLCDRGACIAHDRICPVGEAAREREAADDG